MSNDSVVTASRLSPASMPGRCFMDQRKLPQRAVRAVWTPFGRPVEPDV